MDNAINRTYEQHNYISNFILVLSLQCAGLKVESIPCLDMNRAMVPRDQLLSDQAMNNDKPLQLSYLHLIIQISYPLQHISCFIAGVPLQSRSHQHKRQPQRDCEKAATNLGEVLTRLSSIIPANLPVDVTDSTKMILGRDLFDQDTREEFLCQFEG